MKQLFLSSVTITAILFSHPLVQLCFAQVPTGTVENIDLANLSKDRSQWPGELSLLDKTDFPVMIDGKESGVVTVPKGTKVKLIELIGSKARVCYNGATKVIPTASTDLVALAISAHKQSEAAPSPTPHPAKGAMKAAIQLYPDLAKKDSAFHLLFLDLLNQRKKTDPVSLTQPEWPLDMAQEIAKKLGIQPSSAPSPTPAPKPLGHSALDAPALKSHHADPIIRHGRIVGYHWTTSDQ